MEKRKVLKDRRHFENREIKEGHVVCALVRIEDVKLCYSLPATPEMRSGAL